MFEEKNIDELLEMLANPRLVMYYYRKGISVGEALMHPRQDYKFWTNQVNSDIDALNNFIEDYRLHTISEPLYELLGNASIHGNAVSWWDAPNGDPMKSLSIKGFIADDGLLVRIRNEGHGFDYKETIGRYFRGKKYATGFGNGMRILSHPYFIVTYEDRGRASNFLIRV